MYRFSDFVCSRFRKKTDCQVFQKYCEKIKASSPTTLAHALPLQEVSVLLLRFFQSHQIPVIRC